ncbi:hypothetical protein QTP88_007556 [Uroleucon formosanum]
MPHVVTRKGKGKDKKDKEIVIFTELRFIDSFKFLPSSLDKLTNNLRNDSKLNLRNKFKELSKFFFKEHLDLVTRKLAYPYEYMDCEEKFNETCLPPIEKCYSSLTDKNITIEEYKNSQKIWKVFNIQNLREFTRLYNKIDVLLLSDIIKKFRDISFISFSLYKLDPLWYYTTPGFAWDCMLRMTKKWKIKKLETLLKLVEQEHKLIQLLNEYKQRQRDSDSDMDNDSDSDGDMNSDMNSDMNTQSEEEDMKDLI